MAPFRSHHFASHRDERRAEVMLKRTTLLAALVVLLGLATMPVQADSKLDFTIANRTGYGIAELYVAPSASTDWEENLLEETLANGEDIEITFSRKAEK